jgi:glycosyltransferase involved in cell wall biosynthesis
MTAAQPHAVNPRPRTVLMVSYAYPPHGSPGALRTVKFARYLPESGWMPVVVAPRSGYSSSISGLTDEAEAAGARVVRTSDLGWVLRHLAPGATPSTAVSAARTPSAAPAARPGAGTRARAALVRTLHRHVVPDRNIGWYPFAAAAAAQAARTERPAVVFSTSPSATNHLVGMRAAARLGVGWVADFRDPWTLSPAYDPPTWRRGVDRRIERGIVERATRIVVTTAHDVELFAAAYPFAREKLRVVRNGFDPADFAALPGPPARGPFTLTHAGSFYGGGRDPDALLAAMASLRSAGVLTPANFRLQLVGNPDAAVRARVQAHGVGELVEETGAVPYAQALERLASASVVLMLTHLDVSSVPVKFYDYLGVRRPILALTNPEFEVAGMVRESGGTVLHAQDVEGIRAWLAERVAGGAPPAPAVNGTHERTRQMAARDLAAVLDEAAQAAPRR